MRLRELLSNPSNGLRVVVARYTKAYLPLIISSQIGVQSRHILSVTTFRVILHSLAFKATISLQLGIQSHHRFSVTMFKVIFLSLTFRDVSSQFWRSKPSSSSVWRSEPHLHLDIQSHYPCIVWRSEPPSPYNLAFRATISL